ncbi:MAG: alkaline phosphatase family protein [Actinomycetota bacterium]
MDRREFLKKTAVVAGAGAASTLVTPELLRAATRTPSVLDLPPVESPIDTVVVLMMENRSFDHYLGWLRTDEVYIEQGLSRYGPSFRVDGDNEQTFVAPDGEPIDTYYLPEKPDEENPYRGCEHPDPGHGWDDGRAQRDGGFLAEGSENDLYALGYYREEDIPYYARLAREFTVFDNYHCSLLGPTFPNREYLHSAQSGGTKDNTIPFESRGFQWETIWDRLMSAGVPSGYFFVDLPVTALWGERLIPVTHHIEQFFGRAATGTLPNVTFVDPGFTTGFRTDDHPYCDIRAGQRYVYNIIKAVVESPQWERTALFITYDEWGGFFDHVAPPHLPDDRASSNDEEDFSQAGFRVPTLLASPFAPKGFVDHQVYDHTSILRFLEWRFLGAPPRGPGGKGWYLTKRDRFARNIGDSLMPDNPVMEFDTSDPFQVPVTSAPCPGEELEGLPIPSLPTATEQQRYLEMHGFEQALLAGYFERAGYKVDLRTPPSEAFSKSWAS